MSGEPAIRKVLVRLKAWLDGHVGTGVTVFIDRNYDEPYRDEDLPYVNIRADRVDFELVNYGGALQHSAHIKFDIAAKDSAASNIDSNQAEIAAALHARMWAMDYTPGNIGELLQDRLPLSMGPEEDRLSMSDAGESTFVWRLTWLTALTDIRTVIDGNNQPIP